MSCFLLQITPVPEVVPHNDPLTALSQFKPLRWQVMCNCKFPKSHLFSSRSEIVVTLFFVRQGQSPLQEGVQYA